jgi:HEAT repeat protein
MIQDEVLKITTKEWASAHPEIRTFDVQRLIDNGHSPDDLMRAITKCIAPASWSGERVTICSAGCAFSGPQVCQVFAAPAGISCTGGVLVVRQSRPINHEIAHLLAEVDGIADGASARRPTKLVSQDTGIKATTAAEWIEQLRGAAKAPARAKAAEALGYMARKGTWTTGGFSDIPVVSDEPPKLSAESLEPIVAALVAALNDREPRVRAAAAIAVSWIGERADAAVPELIRLLKDDQEDVRKNAVTAIGRLGPAAKGAIPQLKPLLKGPDAYRRVDVAEALRLVGASPDSFVPTLIELLRGSAHHYAALELAHLGDAAAGALKFALHDKDAHRRMYAAYAFSNMAGRGNLKDDRDSVADELIALTSDANTDVVFKAVQALGSVKAAPARSIPRLIALLKHADPSVVGEAAESLGEFGTDAKPALPVLVKLFADVKDEYFHTIAMAVREIGIDRDSAEALRTVKIGEAGSWLLIPLCRYPDAAAEFLQGNPESVDVPASDHDTMVRLMKAPDPRLEDVQKLLYNSEQLSLSLMAELGERRFLPLLERKMKTADAHERTHLEACARACGAAAGRVVTISASEPGEFKPKSAWPDTDAKRMSPKMQGHGDGFTTAIITGRILREGGRPVQAPKFYRLNDSMLLGQRTRDEVPIRFDKETGRFVFVDNVFAAYSMGDGQEQPGPYQTGSSIVLIECDGCKPLEVRFYDEMPDVQITLSAADK